MINRSCSVVLSLINRDNMIYL